MTTRKYLFENALPDAARAPELAQHGSDDQAIEAGGPTNSAMPPPAAGAATGRSTKSEDALALAANKEGAGRIAPANYTKGEPYTCTSWDDSLETIATFDGKSWTITQKDIRTGLIERFTQSGSGPTGRLEMIQGTATLGAGDALHRKLFGWAGVEDRGSALSTSLREAPLSRSMRADVAGLLIAMPNQMGDGLENLLPSAVRAEMKREAEADAARLNAAAPGHPSTTPARMPEQGSAPR